MNIELLETGFAALEDHAERLVERFNEELFDQYPGVNPLFKNTDPDAQQKKLLSALKLVVSSLRKPGQLQKKLASDREKTPAIRCAGRTLSCGSRNLTDSDGITGR